MNIRTANLCSKSFGKTQIGVKDKDVPREERFKSFLCQVGAQSTFVIHVYNFHFFQNFLSSGGCPYHERCTYIHERRLRSDRVVIRTQTVKTVEPKDSFFWPDLEYDPVISKFRSDTYQVPYWFVENKNNFHNCGIFSMWNHLLIICSSPYSVLGKKDVSST